MFVGDIRWDLEEVGALGLLTLIIGKDVRKIVDEARLLQIT